MPPPSHPSVAVCALLLVAGVTFGAVAPLLHDPVAVAPLVRVQDSSGRWGFTRDGQTVIPFRYPFAEPFSEGLALVQEKPGEKFYIDERGRRAFAQSFFLAYSFRDGLAMVETEDEKKWGVIDRHGSWVAPPQYLWSFDPTRAVSETIREGGWVMLDRDGNIMEGPSPALGAAAIEQANNIPGAKGPGDVLEVEVYGRFAELDVFSEGLCAACEPGPPLARRCGYIDESGEWVIRLHTGRLGAFRGGLALVGDYGDEAEAFGHVFIDRTGAFVPHPRFDASAPGFPASGKIAFPLEDTRVWLRRDGTEVIAMSERCWRAVRSGKPLNRPLLHALGCSEWHLGRVPPTPPNNSVGPVSVSGLARSRSSGRARHSEAAATPPAPTPTRSWLAECMTEGAGHGTDGGIVGHARVCSSGPRQTISTRWYTPTGVLAHSHV